MIEDATVIVNEIIFPTRLHEHGKEPTTNEYQPRAEWLYTGYLEGKRSWLQSLVDSGSRELKIWKDGKLEVTLLGVVWGPICDCTDDHEILHLDWADEDPKPYDPWAE